MKHLLIAGIDNVPGYQRPKSRGVVIGEFPNWSQAIAGWQYADELERPEGVKWFAVRSADDPEWAKAPRARGRFGAWGEEPRNTEEAVYRIGRKAENAGREWRRKHVGSEALRVIKSNPEASFRKLEVTLDGDLKAAGLETSAFDVTDALKARVLVGRCWTCDRAYWMPKAQGPLHKCRCAVCNGPLNQTTLSLRRHFHRLPVREEARA